MNTSRSVMPPGDAGLSGRSSLPLINRIIVAFIFFLIARPAEVLGVGQSLPIGNILVLCVVAVFLVQWQKIPKAQIGKSFITLSAALIFACACVSIFYSVWRTETLQFLTSSGAVLLVLFVAVGVACTSSQIVFAYLRAIGWATLFLAIAIVLDHNTGRASVNGAYDTNDVALVMVGGIPFVFLMVTQSTGMKKILLIAGLVVQVTAILLTQSRGGFLGLGAATLLLWASSPYAGRGGWAKKAALAGAMAIIGLVVWSILPSDAQERLNFFGTLGTDYNLDDPNGRLNIWKLGLSTLMESPWGIGAGCFTTALGLEHGVYKAPHSSYLQVAVELGVIPGIVYLILWWRLFALGGKIDLAAKHLEQNERWVGLTNLGWVWRSSILGLAVSASFLSQAYSYLIFSLFAMTAALEVQLRLFPATNTPVHAKGTASSPPMHRAS